MANTKAKKEVEENGVVDALFGEIENTDLDIEEEQADEAPAYSDAPIRLTDNKTHKVYQLDYDRATCILAERAGLVWDELTVKPAFTITLAWYLAFRKNHPQVTEPEATRMLRDLGGITPEIIGKLRHLYDNGLAGLMNLDGEVKNAKMTVEL